MDFEDDIRLGDYSPAELDDGPIGGRAADGSVPNRFSLTTGLIVSLMLHLILITLFLSV